ncbi:MAG: hypothetical protein Q9220_000595 [cf. Caloplaca sp. 1 TL-2023]
MLSLTSSLFALGTLDDAGRPWTTMLAGEKGFLRPLGQSKLGIKALVSPAVDPVLQSLFGSKQKDDGIIGLDGGEHRVVSGLGIDLATRNRVKLAGQMIAGGLNEVEGKTSEVQMVFKVEQSLSNCPKYLNKKNLTLTLPKPSIASTALPLPQEAVQLLAKADLFFISSSYGKSSMGTNYRGGPPGFVRIMHNNDSGTTLVYPEYSGNRFYQTLGNLRVTPSAGLVIPDFENGDVLYLTGTTEIIIGTEAANVLPRSNLAVKVHILEARYVRNSLSFRGTAGEPSPYNPTVRFLTTERPSMDIQKKDDKAAYAKLIKKEILTPSIGRFRFSVSDSEVAGRWSPGQYVALAFEDELGAGYSHMRNDDPLSLNDDLVRTFTVSSSVRGPLPKDEFEVTVRNVGKVTDFLFRQNIRAGLEVPLRGFAGSFVIHQSDDAIVPFVAGGIGITPLLTQLPDLDLERLRLFWTMSIKDVGLVIDTFERCPRLAGSTILYISGGAEAAVRGQEKFQSISRLDHYGAQTLRRRMEGSDIQGQQGLSPTWYICAGSTLRKALLSWLPDRKVVYEDFNY